MLDFYCADQAEDESIPSFATWIEGFLSQISEMWMWMPHFKSQGAVPSGECLNSSSWLERHSPTVQLTVDIESKEKEAELLAEQKSLPHSDPWAKLVGRANEDQIIINGHPVTALLDTGIVHCSFCALFIDQLWSHSHLHLLS